MGLLDEVRAEQSKRRRGGVCGVRKLLDRMDDEDCADLTAALEDRDNITAPAIASVLEARGLEVGPQAIERHRRGVCKCPR